jgi:hypothetical protein
VPLYFHHLEESGSVCGEELLGLSNVGGSRVEEKQKQYGAQRSTLHLLAEYLAGEKDASLNLSHLEKQLNDAA